MKRRWRWQDCTSLSRWLNAPVYVDFTPQGTVTIRDEGIYFFQYDLETPQTAGEPNVIVNAAVRVPATADKAVFITHGWIDKAQKDWPEKMADAIRQKKGFGMTNVNPCFDC